MNVLARTLATRARFGPILLRVACAVSSLVIASRLNLAIVLHGWQNNWSPELTFLAGLAPAATLVAIFCGLALREPADQDAL
jgi:hypothetical protein